MEAKDGTLLPRSRAGPVQPAWRAGRAPAVAARPTRNSAKKASTSRSRRSAWGRNAPKRSFPNTNSAPRARTSAASSSSTRPPTTRARCSQNAKGEPVTDGREEGGEQVGATSGLFCAYNEGETEVTISAGGLSYTLPVTVQAGSVREPCGTVPLRELPSPNPAGRGAATAGARAPALAGVDRRRLRRARPSAAAAPAGARRQPPQATLRPRRRSCRWRRRRRRCSRSCRRRCRRPRDRRRRRAPRP